MTGWKQRKQTWSIYTDIHIHNTADCTLKKAKVVRKSGKKSHTKLDTKTSVCPFKEFHCKRGKTMGWRQTGALSQTCSMLPQTKQQIKTRSSQTGFLPSKFTFKANIRVQEVIIQLPSIYLHTGSLRAVKGVKNFRWFERGPDWTSDEVGRGREDGGEEPEREKLDGQSSLYWRTDDGSATPL